jgi:hypothetical protein
VRSVLVSQEESDTIKSDLAYFKGDDTCVSGLAPQLAVSLYLAGPLTLWLFDDPHRLSLLQQISRTMNHPFQLLFSAFRLHDDDARVIIPLFISAVSWGLVGGGLASLV